MNDDYENIPFFRNKRNKVLDNGRALIISLVLLIVGILICIIFNPSEVKSQTVAIQFDQKLERFQDYDFRREDNLKSKIQNPKLNRRLVANIYTPKNTSAPYPTMLLCHGINSSKEVMAALAIELARNGIATIAFDFGNFGESYRRLNNQESIQNIDDINLSDARTVLAFVRSHPERFDINRIGIAGHSMGGSAALGLAREDSSLRSTIVLGIGGLANPKSPQNLLFGVGLYDQLNPIWELRELTSQRLRDRIKEATGLNIAESQLSGDFTNGTARKLTISLTADHVTAPYNPLLLKEAISWVRKSLLLSNNQLRLVTPWFIFGLITTFIGAISTSACLLVWGNQNIAWLSKGSISFLIATGMVLIWALAVHGIGSKEWASNLLIFGYTLQSITNYILRSKRTIVVNLIVMGLYSVVLAIAFVLPSLFNGISEVLTHPIYLLQLPQFLLYWAVFLIYNYAQAFKVTLFSAYSLELQPSYLFIILLCIELLLPGKLLTIFERISIRVVHWVRQPLNFKFSGTLSKKSIVLSSVLLIVLIAILYQRIQTGLISEAASRGFQVFQLLFQLIVLPAISIIFILRSSTFRSLENRIFSGH